MTTSVWIVIVGIIASGSAYDDDRGPSARDHPSIAEAIRANPGRMIHVPPGDYEIDEPLELRTDGSGLSGSGRIIQTNPDRPIVRVEGASGVRLRGLTLTRAEGRMDATAEAVIAISCDDLVVEGLRVIDNRTRTAAIELRECRRSQVRDCLVRNYQRISIDDRTDSANYGFAFRCIIGTGILVREAQGALIQGNRVVEERLIPTQEVKEQFELGRFVKKNPARGLLASQKDWDAEYTDNWMQGTAIHVGSPESTDFVQVLGNMIQNAGQGIDVHADHVIVGQNTIDDALIGMKAMHGSRHVLIVGNQFSKNTLWSIGLMPGAASHPGLPARDGQPAKAPNVDGGSIIANNIISDFGYGRSRWIWGGGDRGYPIRFDRGQNADDPPLSDVVVQGNIVFDAGPESPRYKYAVLIEQGPGAPRGLHFSNNILHPGTEGVSNVELEP